VVQIDLHQIEETAAFLQRKGINSAPRLVILGTGFHNFIAHLEQVQKISYSEIPHFPSATMDEPGFLIKAKLNAQSILAMKGRYHHYEGYQASEIIHPLRVLKLLGLKELIISNSAMSLRPELAEGSLGLIKDHINLIPDNPLRGYNFENLGPRFPDLEDLYSPRLRRFTQNLIKDKGLNVLPELVYLAHAGPSCPSPAERNFYRIAGADVYGMSTSMEAIAAAHMQIEVLAISVIRHHKQSALQAEGDQKLSTLLADYLKNAPSL